MANEQVDPRWAKLLSLTAHEFRTPMTVVAGYIRMLLKDRAGPLAEPQRKLLEEAEKSCGRLSALLSEVSDLSGLEGGTAAFNFSVLDFPALLREAVGSLPDMPDRHVAIDLETSASDSRVRADAVRLKMAVTSILLALRRELVTSDRLIVRQRLRTLDGRDVTWVAIGDADRVGPLSEAEPSALTTFDEWRGGVGLSLPVARRIINAHSGLIWSPLEHTRAGATLALPVARTGEGACDGCGGEPGVRIADA